jgi:hypothetical protein
MNGITAPVASQIGVCVADTSAMLVKNWGFAAAPTYPGEAYPYLFRFGDPEGVDMLPPPGGVGTTAYGDLTNLEGITGQNNTRSRPDDDPPHAPANTPSEKVFGKHYIVRISTPGVGGPYFDPSYGVTYLDAADFERTAVDGYAVLDPRTPNDKTRRIVRRPGGPVVNIAFVDAGPPIVSLSAPATGSTEVPTSPTLSWHAPTVFVNYYTVHISPSSTFATYSERFIAGNTLTISGLAAGTTYYWRVFADNCLAGC